MNNDKNNCRRFEDSELVVAGLLNPAEVTRKTVQDCLFALYGDECVRWLIKHLGRKPPGLADRHNAFHAFNDALMALEFSIQQQRFAIKDRPNACRSYLYRAANWCYIRLQNYKGPLLLELPEEENAPLYPKPVFIFPLEETEKIKKIQDVIQSMQEVCREVLWLKYIDGLTINEIAEKMNIEKTQVSRRLFDCRNKLKKILPLNFTEKY